MKKIRQAVILAGGYGTRLRPFTYKNPKAMYPIYNKPFLEYLIEQIVSMGITDIVLLLGYRAEAIEYYFGDGSKWGASIRYLITKPECETGLRLTEALNEGFLEEEFLLMYCDNYCPIDLTKHLEEYRKNHAKVQITSYINKDGYTKSNLLVDENGQVKIYDNKREQKGLHGVDIGYAIVDRSVIERMPHHNEKFESSIYPKLVEEGSLHATVTEHRYYSIGSWERIELTKQFFSGEKYIFLDRDGTLNVRPPKACYVESPDDFVWLPGAVESVKRLTDNGYHVVLITNQPGIARGCLTDDDIDAIHEKMRRDLKTEGTAIEHIYYCPHDWDEGCECRKPKPGMLFQAQKDLSLDLTKCWMLGDDERDMIAGKDAGCRCIQVSEQHPLAEAVDCILQFEKNVI